MNLKTQDFLKYVEELRKESAVMKVSELMAKVLTDGLEGYFVSLGGDVAIRIKKFVATVQRSDVDGDIGEFLDFCDRYDGEKPPAKKNSVTIITMHRSKGLQYPFVIIPYASNTTAPPPSKHFDSDVYKNYLFLDRELGIALTDSDEEKGYNSDSFATKVHALKKKLEKINELARLMYVAFTRAESRLVIIGEQVKSGVDFEKIDTIDKFIRYAEGKNPSIADYRKPYVNPDDETDEGIEEDDVATEGENTQEDILDVKYDYLFTPYPYEKATTTSLKTTVSEILEAEEGVKRAFTADSEGKGSAEIGTAYHLVMQKIDFATKSQEDIQAFIDKLATEGEIDKVVAEKIEASKIKNLLETKVISEAAGKKLHREMPFLMPYGEEGGLLQGVIDLIIEDEDGLTVVDYKASSADPVTLKNRYEKQIELYSEAAERILKKPVTGRYLLNLMRSYEVRI